MSARKTEMHRLVEVIRFPSQGLDSSYARISKFASIVSWILAASFSESSSTISRLRP